MEFDEILNNRQKRQGNYNKERYYDSHRNDQYSHHSGNENRDYFRYIDIFNKIKENKKIRNLVILGVIIFLFLLIGLIIILFPQLINLINYISENGLQGIVNTITDFLNNILKGSN
jgi:hypothetical protein